MYMSPGSLSPHSSTHHIHTHVHAHTHTHTCTHTHTHTHTLTRLWQSCPRSSWLDCRNCSLSPSVSCLNAGVRRTLTLQTHSLNYPLASDQECVQVTARIPHTTHTHTHTHRHTHTHTHTHRHTHTHTHTHMQSHTLRHTHTVTHTHTADYSH